MCYERLTIVHHQRFNGDHPTKTLTGLQQQNQLQSQRSLLNPDFHRILSLPLCSMKYSEKQESSEYIIITLRGYWCTYNSSRHAFQWRSLHTALLQTATRLQQHQSKQSSVSLLNSDFHRTRKTPYCIFEILRDTEILGLLYSRRYSYFSRIYYLKLNFPMIFHYIFVCLA